MRGIEYGEVREPLVSDLTIGCCRCCLSVRCFGRTHEWMFVLLVKIEWNAMVYTYYYSLVQLLDSSSVQRQ